MTEISEAAKAKAEELMRHQMGREHNAFARFIQQVSDAAKVVAKEISKSPDGNVNYLADERLAPFILPEPVDPLAEAISLSITADDLREELAKRGYKIVKACHDGR